MKLFSIIAILLLEQLWPLNYERLVLRPFYAWLDFLERRFNAGGYIHGILAVSLAVFPFLLAVGLLWWLAFQAGSLALFALYAATLYFMMGFRQFSHFYTHIHLALRMGDQEQAYSLLTKWREKETSQNDNNPEDIARISIESALLASHRHVFAVLFWFTLAGPIGAVLYRMAALLSERWLSHESPFALFSQQLFAIFDWLPVRATAASFAVVGNFEDAVYCWRNQANRWDHPGYGIVLSSGAGALGVRLGIPPLKADTLPEDFVASSQIRPDDIVGEKADADFMQSAVSLVWRTTLLWLLLIFVFGLARLTG